MSLSAQVWLQHVQRCGQGQPRCKKSGFFDEYVQNIFNEFLLKTEYQRHSTWVRLKKNTLKKALMSGFPGWKCVAPSIRWVQFITRANIRCCEASRGPPSCPNWKSPNYRVNIWCPPSLSGRQDFPVTSMRPDHTHTPEDQHVTVLTQKGAWGGARHPRRLKTGRAYIYGCSGHRGPLLT